MSLRHRPDFRRLCFVGSTPRPSCEVSFGPCALRAAAAADEDSFGRKCNVLFLAPFLGTLAVLAVALMRA